MRRKQRRRLRPPPPPRPPRVRPSAPAKGDPPRPGAVALDIMDSLGHHGQILVLFETPSGFALFHYNGVRLFRPKALENIWADFTHDYKAKNVIFLVDFEPFKDKASAINSETGVSHKLERMIKKSLLPKQKLAVGEVKYKNIIETELGIDCLFGETVMELMWGLKNLTKALVPDENLETEEDYLPMSKGMKIILEKNGFDVQPEMVNRRIIDLADTLYECEFCVNKHAAAFKHVGNLLKEISDITSDGWDPLKLVTAVQVICYPKDEHGSEFFSEVELEKLKSEAPKFDGKFLKNSCSFVYKEIVWARGVRDDALSQLKTLLPFKTSEMKDVLHLSKNTRLDLSAAVEPVKLSDKLAASASEDKAAGEVPFAEKNLDPSTSLSGNFVHSTDGGVPLRPANSDATTHMLHGLEAKQFTTV